MNVHSAILANSRGLALLQVNLNSLGAEYGKGTQGHCHVMYSNLAVERCYLALGRSRKGWGHSHRDHRLTGRGDLQAGKPGGGEGRLCHKCARPNIGRASSAHGGCGGGSLSGQGLLSSGCADSDLTTLSRADSHSPTFGRCAAHVPC